MLENGLKVSGGADRDVFLLSYYDLYHFGGNC